MLAGNWPFYNGLPHPTDFLQYRLEENKDCSLLEQVGTFRAQLTIHGVPGGKDSVGDPYKIFLAIICTHFHKKVSDFRLWGPWVL